MKWIKVTDSVPTDGQIKWICLETDWPATADCGNCSEIKFVYINRIGRYCSCAQQWSIYWEKSTNAQAHYKVAFWADIPEFPEELKKSPRICISSFCEKCNTPSKEQECTGIFCRLFGKKK